MLTVAFPWIAFVVGGAFLAAWRWRRARSAMLAGTLWLLYGVYECLMHLRVLCSGECNIRVDLLLICPVLLGVPLAAVWNSVRAARASTRRPAKSAD
jgi:hypothetical protein